MGRFITPLKYENIDGSRLKLTENLVYFRDLQGRESITVPAGFECDGQSYPRLLWFVDHPQGKGAKAGFLHDYLYWMNGYAVPHTGINYSRKASDQMFYEALISCGVPRWRARVRYRMLRLFGGLAWGKHRKRIEKEHAGS